MITNITLENFKCFRRISIDPKLVTVFIGPNGTGKSGVLQALMLLKQSRNDVRQLIFDGELLRFAPEEFMWRGVESRSNDVQLSLYGSSPIDSKEVQGALRFGVDLLYSRDAKLIADFGSTKWTSSDREYDIPFDRQRSHPQAMTPRGSITYNMLPQINSFKVAVGIGDEDPSSPLWSQISQAPAEMLGNLKFVPAARGLTRGVYTLGRESSDDISGASGLGAQEDDTATTLAYSRPEVDKVSRLMKQITGVGFRVDTVPPQSAMPVSESIAGDFSLLAEGFGTNALVHLLFEVARTVSGATVLIEEPEIHLHPKAQADLASVLIEEAKSDGKQIVMTTHSEHVAGRMLTMVAEGRLSSAELAIYSFEKDKTGACSASEIEVTDRGQVNRGLKSFFETDLDEMRRYVEALRAKV